MNATFSLEWLLQGLQKRGFIDAGIRREIEVRAPEQRARILKSIAGDTSGVGRYNVSPVELIASMQFKDPQGKELDQELLAGVVAAEAGLSYHKIDPLELDMALVTRTLSRPFALRHVMLPLKQNDDGLTVAMENPFDVEAMENMRRIVKGKVVRVVASKNSILKALTEIYGFKKSIESAARDSHRGDSLSDFEQLVKLRSVGEIEGTDQHVVNAVDFLLRYAFDQRASDIHIEPRRNDSQVRLRIDGVLHNVHTFPRQVQPAIASRIKTMARMDIAEKRRPQDGRIKTVLADKSVELRVSTLPVAFGEKIVIRIFDPETLLKDLPDLGFDDSDLSVFERWIAEPHGLILVTGPTGSGKTTTLYAALKALSDSTLNVTSVEDPIEMVTEIFNQVAVQPKAGVDFPSALRTILRQDPDIIMVGEIRDAETAEMAVQAALTGHLVMSTLHTNDSVGAITRLMDLGVPPFLASSTLLGVMAQRLLRRICKDCSKPASLSADQVLALGLDLSATNKTVYSGSGCVNCRGTGYWGRTGIYEVLDIHRELASLISKKAGEEELRAAALKNGMRTLRQSGEERLFSGLTSFDELVRVTGVRGDAR